MTETLKLYGLPVVIEDTELTRQLGPYAIGEPHRVIGRGEAERLIRESRGRAAARG